MPGHLFEGKPVDEGTTRRGTDTPCGFCGVGWGRAVGEDKFGFILPKI